MKSGVVNNRAKMKYFPSHGLLYKGGDRDDPNTFYKRELERLRDHLQMESPEEALESFRRYVKFDLNGLEDNLRSIHTYYSEGNTRYSGGELRAIQNLARGDLKGTIFKLVNEIDAAHSKQECLDIINQTHNIRPDQGRADVRHLLQGFLDKNADKMEYCPSVFFKYALRSELVLLERQLTTLGVTSKKIHVKNVERLDREDQVVERRASFSDSRVSSAPDYDATLNKSIRGKMIDYIARKKTSEKRFKRFTPIEEVYEREVEYPIEAASAQLAKMLSGGAMNVALKDPSTKKYQSSIDGAVLEDEIISESQHDVLRQIEKALRIRRDKTGNSVGGGKVKIRMPTASGKTTLVEKYVPRLFLGKGDADISVSSIEQSPNRDDRALFQHIDEIVSLDLNSSQSQFDELRDEDDLNGKMIILDEEYYYHRMHKMSGKQRLDVEKEKNDFLHDLERKGAVVITLGASESLDRLDFEEKRTQGKLDGITQSRLTEGKGPIIREANRNLYSIDHHTFPTVLRDGKVINNNIFDEVFQKECPLSTQWQKAVTFGKEVTEKGQQVTKQHYIRRAKGGMVAQDVMMTGVMNNLEFLTQFAYYIRELDEIIADTISEEQKAHHDACMDGVTKEKRNRITGRKTTQKTVEGINDLLLGERDLGTLMQIARNEVHGAKIKGTELYDRVNEYLSAGYHLLFPGLHGGKPNPDSSKGREDALNRKLRIRKFEKGDLERRRGKVTRDRYELTTVYTTSFDNPDELKLSDIFAEGMEGVELQDGQKVQYIVPDFDINRKTCDGNELHNIFYDSGADIVILPHLEDGKKLEYSVSYLKDGVPHEIQTRPEIYHRDGSLKYAKFNIDDALKYITAKLPPERQRAPIIVSFFDQKNAIGGDYGNASSDISAQIIHLVRDDCMSDEFNGLTWNHMMQYNRDRTDPDSVNYDRLRLRMLLPEAALGFSSYYGMEGPKGVIREKLDFNTQADDAIHLQGIVESKKARGKKVIEYAYEGEREAVMGEVVEDGSDDEDQHDFEDHNELGENGQPLKKDPHDDFEVSRVFLSSLPSPKDNRTRNRMPDRRHSTMSTTPPSGAAATATSLLNRSSPYRGKAGGPDGDMSFNPTRRNVHANPNPDVSRVGGPDGNRSSNNPRDNVHANPDVYRVGRRRTLNLSESVLGDRTYQTPEKKDDRKPSASDFPDQQPSASTASPQLRDNWKVEHLDTNHVTVKFTRNEPNYWSAFGRGDSDVDGNILRSYQHIYGKEPGLMGNTIFNILVLLVDQHRISKDALSKMIENYRRSGLTGNRLVLADGCDWEKDGKDIKDECRKHTKINRQFQALTKACGLYAFRDGEGVPIDGLRFCDIPDNVENHFNAYFKEEGQKGHTRQLKRAQDDVAERGKRTRDVHDNIATIAAIEKNVADDGSVAI